MIQGITTRIQQLPGTTHGTVFQHMHSRMKGRLEGAWDNEIAKAVKDDRDLNPLLGFAREMFLKFLANSIIFPDVRLEINTLLCRIDCLEHGIKQLTSVGVQFEDILPNLHFLEWFMRKAHLMFTPFS